MVTLAQDTGGADVVVDHQPQLAARLDGQRDDVDPLVGESAAHAASAPGLLGRRRVSSVRIAMAGEISRGRARKSSVFSLSRQSSVVSPSDIRQLSVPQS